MTPAIDRTAVICQSMGGWAGMHFAHRHQDRAGALVVRSSPTPLVTPRNKEVQDRSIETATRARAAGLGSHTYGVAPPFVKANPGLTYLYDALARLNGPRNVRAMQDADVAFRPEDFAEFKVPTMVAGGANDHLLRPDHYIYIAGLIPDAIAHTFEKSGHSAYFEEPEAFNQSVFRVSPPRRLGVNSQQRVFR
jgi:pimeloyl-ACP methyl ester carboxylesterase